MLIKDFKVEAVLDWGCAMYGDFLYDLSWFIFWQFYYPSMNGIDFQKEFEKYARNTNLNLHDIEIRIHAYQLHIGLASLDYCASPKNWEHSEMITKRLLKLI